MRVSQRVSQPRSFARRSSGGLVGCKRIIIYRCPPPLFLPLVSEVENVRVAVKLDVGGAIVPWIDSAVDSDCRTEIRHPFSLSDKKEEF